jgi:inorganic phosphate transporter, PiT family
MSLLVTIIILALVFDYINGFHDAANSIATVVSTKVLTPFQAVIWAAFFNFVAYFIFKDHAVANTIGKTVNADFITLGVILAGLIAAIFWNLLTWWFGIPSSSSHTLIGGFAGAAMCYAYMHHGFDISWDKIVDSKIILQTVLFIFLAPLIGMIISMFITTATILQNIWLRFAVIGLATLFAVFLFDKFEENKMQEATEKFLKVDKYKKEIKAAEAKLVKDTKDEKAIKDLSTAKEKLEKALPNLEKLNILVKDFDKLGAKKIAEEANKEGLLKDIEASKLKDEIRNANGYLVLEAESIADSEKKKEFKIAKEKTEDYKKPLKKFLAKEMPKDSLMAALDAIYTIRPENTTNVLKKIDGFNIEKALFKAIDKCDNSGIVWGIILTSLLFCLVYLYVEKIKTPTAYKISEMFKKLQLFSSAAFSIGHGGNDAQKVMGIIGAALIASGQIQEFSQLPTWVPFACYAAIGIGTMSGGWKIVKTMGTKITKVTPLEGVAAESAGAFTLFFTGQMGIPVSTTHTITGSIIGVGATKRLSAVRWGVTINLLWAWILTIPVSALVAALTYYAVTLFGIK